MNRTTDETCAHCQCDYNLKEAFCDDGIGLLHCENHRGQCVLCKETFCCESLIETPEGEWLCEECSEIEKNETIRAARRAARTGDRRDLEKYLNLRKAI